MMELLCFHKSHIFTYYSIPEKVWVTMRKCKRCEESWRDGEAPPDVVIGVIRECAPTAPLQP